MAPNVVLEQFLYKDHYLHLIESFLYLKRISRIQKFFSLIVLPSCGRGNELFFGILADVCRDCCLLLLLLFVDVAERERDSKDFMYQS